MFALFNNTSGFGNTAIGGGALNPNTTGNSNTAIGVDALGDNNIASNNTAIGIGALTNNTTAGENTAIGADASQVPPLATITPPPVPRRYMRTPSASTTPQTVIGRCFPILPLITTQPPALLHSKCISGNDNTANGVTSLLANTTGSSNTARGLVHSSATLQDPTISD